MSVNLGCGGSPSNWRYVFNGVARVTATASGMVFVNIGCTTSSCSLAPRGTLGGTTNPVTDSTQCTYRAAAFWAQMTGRYHPWAGNAGYWDNNAPPYGWQVRSWPEPDSLIVFQPNTGGSGSAGHVGYAADIRSVNGRWQVKMYDRNVGYPPRDRDGVWIDVPPGAKFIRVPPRYTKYVR